MHRMYADATGGSILTQSEAALVKWRSLSYHCLACKSVTGTCTSSQTSLQPGLLSSTYFRHGRHVPPKQAVQGVSSPEEGRSSGRFTMRDSTLGFPWTLSPPAEDFVSLSSA